MQGLRPERHHVDEHPDALPLGRLQHVHLQMRRHHRRVLVPEDIPVLLAALACWLTDTSVAASWHASWPAAAIASARQAVGQPCASTLNHGRPCGSAQPQVRGHTSRSSRSASAPQPCRSSTQLLAFGRWSR